MSRGRLPANDEPSMGLAPRLVQEFFRIIQNINRSGTTIACGTERQYGIKHCSRAYVLEHGYHRAGRNWSGRFG